MLDPDTGDLPLVTPSVNGHARPRTGYLQVVGESFDPLPLAEEIPDGPRDATPAEVAAWRAAGEPYPPPWVEAKRACCGTCPNRSGA